jgi:hypothetical protein
MSKSNNGDQLLSNQADLTPPAGGSAPAGNPAPGGSGILAIEEHAKRMNIDKPIFAAVMQSENWASGKKVPEAVFKKAVEGFLNGSMGGK